MLFQFPSWLLIIDYIFGFIMWLLIIRFSLNILFTNDSNIKFIKQFFDLTNYIISVFKKIIPSFIPVPLISIYLAWLFFMVRFYFLPVFKGFDAIGYLSFPFERLMYKHTYEVFIQYF